MPSDDGEGDSLIVRVDSDGGGYFDLVELKFVGIGCCCYSWWR